MTFLPLATALASADPNPPAPVRIVGDRPGDGFGWDVESAGDVDGDGRLDVVVGAPSSDALMAFAGRMFVFHGSFTAPTPRADTFETVSTPLFGDNLGGAVAAAGDVNGDGVGDIVVGARGNDAAGIQAGRAYLFLGPVTEPFADQADAVISGTAFEEIGRSVASAGDLNGDGFDDILVGTGIGGPADEGRVYVFNGPLTGAVSITSASAVIVGAVADDALGASVVPAGDLNGDGFDDIVVGAPRTIALGNTNGPGRVYVFHGPLTGTIAAGSAAAVLTGELLNDDFGVAVAVGDVNGDGTTDLVVGADQLFRNDGTGKAYVFHGPLSGQVQAANANAILRGSALDDLFGGSVAVGDVDGDGRDDVIVGAQGAALASGRGYVFRGPLAGSIPAASAAFIVNGAAGDELGRSVAAIDVVGQGRPAAVFGASALTSGARGYVAAYPDPIPSAKARKAKREATP